jgi:hypothetical protein
MKYFRRFLTFDRHEFKELKMLRKILPELEGHARIEVIDTVKVDKQEFPIFGIVIGPDDKSLPTFGLFGGVHGLEKIGTHIAIMHLKHISQQLKWDQTVQDMFTKTRLVAIPLVNPSGMFLNRRSNKNGVDIMRNGPTEDVDVPNNLISGHSVGPWLPWFKGFDKMETETKALTKFVSDEMFDADVSLALDLHSGFGMVDRLWFPYARSVDPFPSYDQALEMKKLVDRNIPYHTYQIEPQADSYLINGDPWDYIYDQHYEKHKGKKLFIPWTLEIGSWVWIRKNPKQLFSYNGIFNPIIPHRYERVMRRHRYLLDFYQRAVLNHSSWCDTK